MDDLLGVCGFLPNFLDKGSWTPTTPLQDLVLRTVARGRSTFEVIVDLVASDKTLQAAMLGRALFEDMVVAHWLVLNREDPYFLIERFQDHRDALRLNDAAVREEFGLDPSGDDVSELEDRATELRDTFGPYAERDWWGLDREGNRVSMPELVDRLAAEPMFQPRLSGEKPILKQYYALQQKAWTQALHHTAAGMRLRESADDRFPEAIADPSPLLILLGNYWAFGQLIFVALELATDAHVLDYFQKLFLAGLAVFTEAVDQPAPWADQVARWAEELESEDRASE
jgi:hypothetical protein